jgi:twitching motility two-component system response regulator PilH
VGKGGQFSSERDVVLVVEDDRDTREMYAMALRMSGFDVRSAEDGMHALVHLEQETPSAIVLDLDLPGINGVDLQQELRAHAETRGVPVVIVSGAEWPSPIPAYATMRKPVTPEAVVRMVKRAAFTSHRY